MDIPVINRIAVDELPSPFSNLLISASQISFFFKWGAFAIAVLASFSTLMKAIRIIIVNYFTAAASPISQDAVDECSDDDYDDESLPSTSYPSSDSEADSDDTEEEDFRVQDRGESSARWRTSASNLRRRKNNSLVDLSSLFMSGKNVVRLWENAAFGMVSPAASANGMTFPTFFSGNVGLSADRLLRMWDARVGGWESPTRNDHVSETNLTGGFIVRDGASGRVSASDVRMPGSRLLRLTEADVNAWMDTASRN